MTSVKIEKQFSMFNYLNSDNAGCTSPSSYDGGTLSGLKVTDVMKGGVSDKIIFIFPRKISLLSFLFCIFAFNIKS